MIALILLLFTLSLSAETPLELPWLTGPLIAPTPYTLPKGHLTFQPYVRWTHTKGEYGPQWQPSPVRRIDTLLIQPLTKFGVFEKGEFDILPQLYYSNSEGPSALRLGDLPMSLSYQLAQEDKFLNSTSPDLKLRFDVTFPLGHYNKLNPNKFGVDASGGGSWNPGVTLVLGKFFHFTPIHWLVTRWVFSYAVGTPTFVKGLSTYGGTPKTRGTVYPGNIYAFDLGLEFTLARRVALACDLFYEHANKTRFSGRSGGIAPTLPSGERFLIAPAIEYNHSAQLGWIFGPSIALAGRNSFQEITWIISMTLRH